MLITLLLLMTSSSALAQSVEGLEVHIEVDPDVRILTVGEEARSITIMARTPRQDDLFAWSLQGAGELRGDLSGPGVMYIPPTKLSETSAKAAVRVVVTNSQGNSEQQELVFTLRQPLPPTPTPSPIPSPSPTPSPTPTPLPTAPPTPLPTPTPQPLRIRQLTLRDEQGIPKTPIYEVKAGETLSIDVESIIPPGHDVQVECVAIFGAIEEEKHGGIRYTAPVSEEAQDMLTVKVIDAASKRRLLQQLIKIRISAAVN